MSSGQQENEAAQQTTEQPKSLLDSITDMMPRAIERDEAQDMVKNLVSAAMKGTVVWDRNINKTISRAMKQIDEQMSKQLAEVLHHDQFQKLEGSWRGLNHLVMNSETGKQLKLRVLNVSKKDLYKDLDKAVEFDQSVLWNKLYEEEFGTAGGEPYGALVGDFEFTNHPEDIDMLQKISSVCAAAHCPFISASSPELFGLESWTDLTKPRDIEKIFMGTRYTKWNSFRDSEDSRYVTLVLPRVLGRLPYGSSTKKIDSFGFEEFEVDSNGESKPASHDDYCWMNAAYAMGTNMTSSRRDELVYCNSRS